MTPELQRINESSSYLAALLRRPTHVEWLWGQRNLFRRYPLIELYNDVQLRARNARSPDDLFAAWRTFKQLHFLRIGGRDLLGWADLEETTGQLSDLACVVLQAGLEILLERPRWWLGTEEHEAIIQLRDGLRLVVMGLGKLGGQELNYVSDVDLLFLYSHQGEHREREIEIPPILNRLCQWLSRLLADAVAGDRVFQVDLRLRPLGKDGELVPSLEAATYHYLLHGRPWERQMLLKARPVAGDRSLGTAFLREVRPFVFRRFLDFQAVNELRAMRDRILQETKRTLPGWQQFDVKLGIGGIREIEFLVQSLQLIYGGRHPEVDEPNTLRCLEKLGQLGLLPQNAVAELRDAYIFLRRVEHWVQLDQNRQTQRLPQSPESRRRLAVALGFAGAETPFLEQLEACCGAVHQHFLALFASSHQATAGAPEDSSSAPKADTIESRWGAFQQRMPSELWARLQNNLAGFSPAAVVVLLDAIAGCTRQDALEADVYEKMLVHVDRYFSQVKRRPGLGRFFDTAGPWLASFCRGLVQSELLADLLSHQPSLVEGITRIAEDLAPSDAWESTSATLLASIGDYETAFEWIRRLKNERLLQIVLADLAGSITQRQMEEALSDLADFVIRHTYRRIQEERGLPSDMPLAVLALGKLGSGEMDYLSDLDLVFVYHSAAADNSGQIPMEVVRFIQRLLRMLSTPLQEGPGYEVDTRLRPTGNYGPLVVTRDNWLEYYQQQADLWELQALLRMRAVAGREDLCRWIEEQALRICYREREPTAVWRRLCHLRQRMEFERGVEHKEGVDIKLGAGGVADLEFLVQGNQLLAGWRRPELRHRSIRQAILGLRADPAAGEGRFGELWRAFRTLRALEHRLHLATNLRGSTITARQLALMRDLGLWPPRESVSQVEDWPDLLRLCRRVRQLFREWCTNL
jgi:glutamate-ammonia-ligase adenylyltransferase